MTHRRALRHGSAHAALVPILLALSAINASAAVYYLDPVNGSTPCVASGHTGCNATACRSYTALAAATSIPAGSTVNFCDGDYRETVTVAVNSLTLRRAPGATLARIMGTTQCGAWTADGSGVYHCSHTPAVTFDASTGIQTLFVDGQPLPEYQIANCPATRTDLAAFKTCENYPAKTCTTNADCTLYTAHCQGGANSMAACTVDSQCPGGDGCRGYGPAVCRSGAWCWNDAAQSPANTVYLMKPDGTSPAGNTVEVGSRRMLVDARNTSGTVVDGLTLFGTQRQGNLQDPALDGANTNGITVRNCVFDHLPGLALRITRGGTGTVLVDHNSFIDIGQGDSFAYLGNSDAGNGDFVYRFQGGGHPSGSMIFSNNTGVRVGTHNWMRDAHQCGICCYTDSCFGDTLVNYENPSGLVTMTGNAFTDTEGGFSLKFAVGVTVQLGSLIADNRLTSWPLVPGRNSWSRQPGIATFCSSVGASDCNDHGGKILCDDARYLACGGGNLNVQLRITRNRIIGGWGGLSLGTLNNFGYPYSILADNNFIQGGDNEFGQSFAALVLKAGSAGIKIFNNTVRPSLESADGGWGACIGCGQNNDGTPGGICTGCELRNNVFLFDTAKFTDRSTSGVTYGTNVCTNAIAGKCGGGVSTMTFANAPAADFHVTADPGMVARNTGTDLGAWGVTLDIDGTSHTINGAWDLGADEIGSGPQAPTLLFVESLP